MEGHAVPFGKPPLRLMVRHDAGHVDREVAGRPAVKQIVEAMAALRHRDHEARLGGPAADPCTHLEPLDAPRERFLHPPRILGNARPFAAQCYPPDKAPQTEHGLLLAIAE